MWDKTGIKKQQPLIEYNDLTSKEDTFTYSKVNSEKVTINLL